MVVQYPHIMKFSTLTDPARDENGDYVTPTEVIENTIECRYESAIDGGGSANRAINTADGQSVQYNAKIYLKKDTAAPAAGQEIEIEGICKGRCLQVYFGQLNTTVFI